MRLCRVRRALGAQRRERANSLLGILVAAVVAAAAAGCSSTGQFDGLLPASGGPTIAFETIDGPPPEVFEKLVSALGDEANAQGVTVVSRTGHADYRVRAYLVTAVTRGQVSLAWVWDVYGTDQRRALRIGGEESVQGRHRDAWTVADDAMLRRIARTGMVRVADFLNSPRRREQPEPDRDPDRGAVEVAAAATSGTQPQMAAIRTRP